MKRHASAVWKGGLKDGKGNVASESGALNHIPYNFRMRFEDEKGTNPEELIAAAHAACFSMALSSNLAKQGLTPESIETTATITAEPVNGAFTLTESHLDTVVHASGGDQAAFDKACEDAKAGCPISRLLAPGLKISLNARLA